MNLRKVVNFAKEGNLIASPCKVSFFLQQIHCVFPCKGKILLFEFF